MKKSMGIITIFLFANGAFASNIAIIDSGTDYQHKLLAPHTLTNKGEVANNGKDDDGNGYIDDVLGWNFAENNNQIIDYKYVGTFSPDVPKFFEIQTKILRGRATPADQEWIKQKREDQDFIKELMKFGNFVHGSHVTGISVVNAIGNKTTGVKLIPTEQGASALWVKEQLSSFVQMNEEGDDMLQKMLLKMGLAQLAKQQSELLAKVGQYVSSRHAHVANGSFGTGKMVAQIIVGQLFQMIVGREPTPEELQEFSKAFLQNMVDEGKAFVDAAPNTLFVFAAGNDANNNDEMPTSPANIKTDNTMSVAATLDRGKLASFTNYGQQTVDVAAPGVGILSSIPGNPGENTLMTLSGTSQAAPYVANAAGQVRDANPKLKPAEIRQILMGTVDKKDFLADKVVSGGVVNPKRAARAATLSRKMGVDQAIEAANRTIRDMPSRLGIFDVDMEKDLFVLPLPSLVN